MLGTLFGFVTRIQQEEEFEGGRERERELFVITTFISGLQNAINLKWLRVLFLKL